ncbi:MAG TPA: hypothetical protein GYA07_04320 [Verrucomicrobia bacterium]|nr:hypothetical protein [Verrucomicrobiota bacterium]HOP96071.1 hypothetical protein [Verrucomicrobiota bacterium]
MIEIALCLAIIGFALVAIIGVLPTGMNVQRDNREETIINQEATVWVDAIRNGSFGYYDLTNYVLVITNFWTVYNSSTNSIVNSGVDVYRKADEVADGGVPLTSAEQIIGLLSRPKWMPVDGGAQSNYIVAHVRSMSGGMNEKAPQNHPEALNNAFVYRMIVENTPMPVHAGENDDLAVVRNLQGNAHELRLTFRWPVFPTTVGNKRQTYRVLVSGSLEPFVGPVGQQPQEILYFYRPGRFRFQHVSM